MWDNFIRANICSTGDPGGEWREGRREKNIWRQNGWKNSELVKAMRQQFQENTKIQAIMKKMTPLHTIVKLFQTSDKEKNLKSSQE